MPEDFDLSIGSHADDEVFEDVADLLDGDVRSGLSMPRQTDHAVRPVA